MVMNRALGVSVLLVPAYSKRLDFVLEEARVLGARQLAIVVAATRARQGVRDAVALYVPIRGTEGSVLRPVDPAATGTIHAFQPIARVRGRGEADVAPPVAV